MASSMLARLRALGRRLTAVPDLDAPAPGASSAAAQTKDGLKLYITKKCPTGAPAPAPSKALYEPVYAECDRKSDAQCVTGFAPAANNLTQAINDGWLIDADTKRNLTVLGHGVDDGERYVVACDPQDALPADIGFGLTAPADKGNQSIVEQG